MQRYLFEMVSAVIVTGIALAGLVMPAAFQHNLPALAVTFVAPAQAQSASVDELLKPGTLPDLPLGSAGAKVTIVEYASLTCNHCAHFHVNTLPELKKRYIDTGKVRLILREFPLDPLATAAAMLARCSGEQRYHAVIDLLFSKQRSWAFTDKPVDELLATVKQAGFTQESFETCLKDQKLYDGVNAVKQRGAEVFKVNSTPTLFVNGQRIASAVSIEELEKTLKPLLGE
jgi:protein-disulfide isomerase